MISVPTAIVYVVSVVDKTYNNKNTQKGVAISRTDMEDGYQIYKFIAYMATGTKQNLSNFRKICATYST